MTHIKTFSQLSKNDATIAGGKGASLGEMTCLFGGQARSNPVPPGFVILASAFDRFLREADLNSRVEVELKKAKPKDFNSVDRVSNKIRTMILEVEFPQDLALEIQKEFTRLNARLVAVRSSATAEDSSIASWAGELESYLNTSKKNLLINVKKCWASLFIPRAIFYRLEKKLVRTKVSVVVQAMIQSEISGITFTVHPVTEDRNQMIIEAGWGLGEAIVGGRITPDTYVISKKTDKIVEKNISVQKMMIVKSKEGTIETIVPKAKQEKQKLADKQILALAKICYNIEKHYGKPQDIEWAFEHGKFYIVQSRPITTLNRLVS